MTRTMDYDLAVELLSEPYSLDWEGDLDINDKTALSESGFEWHYGASKVVIVLEDCVLKTSISLKETLDEDFEYEDLPDFARMEYRYYNRAREEGIDKFFCYTVSCGSGVYEQEKVDIIAGDYEDEDTEIDADWYFEYYGIELYSGTEHQMKEFLYAYNLDDMEDYVRPSALRYILGAWSVEDVRKLYNFCKKYNINDIHRNNIGWVKGELKIFDFCGYHFNIDTEEEEGI